MRTPRSEQWLERALFTRGLRGVIEMDEGQHATAVSGLSKLLSHRVFRVLINPVGVYVRDKEIPHELVARILVDGIDAHRVSLEEQYRLSGQRPIDHVRMFQSAYRFAFIVIFAWLTSDNWRQFSEARDAAFKQGYMAHLDDMQKQLNELDEALERAGYYQSEAR
jgi:hypothetical protein